MYLVYYTVYLILSRSDFCPLKGIWWVHSNSPTLHWLKHTLCEQFSTQGRMYYWFLQDIPIMDCWDCTIENLGWCIQIFLAFNILALKIVWDRMVEHAWQGAILKSSSVTLEKNISLLFLCPLISGQFMICYKVLQIANKMQKMVLSKIERFMQIIITLPF